MMFAMEQEGGTFSALLRCRAEELRLSELRCCCPVGELGPRGRVEPAHVAVVPVGWVSMLRSQCSCCSGLGINPVPNVPRLCPDNVPLSPEGHRGIRIPVPSCHTCPVASDLQKPWVTLLSLDARHHHLLPIKPVCCSSKVSFVGRSVDAR